MESGTALSVGAVDGVGDDRRHDGAGRRAVRRSGRGSPQARRRVARRLVRRDRATIVSEIARGLIDLGLEPGDRVALLCTTRAEWTHVRLRHHERRRRGGADLPDQLPRGVRVGGRQLRVALRSSARTPSRSPRSSPSASSCPRWRRSSSSTRRGDVARRHPARRRCASAAAAATPPRSPRARQAVTPDGPVHDHLHLRHDRPAQGLRALARQLPPASLTHVRGDRRHRGGRRRLPLPAARALLRAADPAAGGRPRRRRSPTWAATRSRSSPS